MVQCKNLNMQFVQAFYYKTNELSPKIRIYISAVAPIEVQQGQPPLKFFTPPLKFLMHRHFLRSKYEINADKQN